MATIPEPILVKHRAWRRWFMTQSLWNRLFGITSIVTSAIAASSLINTHPTAAPILSLTAACTTGLLAFFRFKDNASAFKAAWRLLDQQILRYHAGKCSEADLYDAVEKGEALIKTVDN